MIKEFVTRYMENKHKLESLYSKKHPDDYEEIVRNVVEILHDENEYGSISPERIHEIDDGGYHGTLVYVIGASGYQPDDYWYVMVGYGSCSGCDTLKSICGYTDEPPTGEQVKDYMTLSLHVVQKLKKMDDCFV